MKNVVKIARVVLGVAAYLTLMTSIVVIIATYMLVVA